MATPVPAPVLDMRNGDQLAAQSISSFPPEMSDRGPTNPLVVFAEAVFSRVDALLFQLGQWPQAVIQKCLSLIGVTLLPAQYSTVLQQFVLSSPQSKDSIILSGTQVATTDGSVVFASTADLTIPAYAVQAGTVASIAGSPGITGIGTAFLSAVAVGGAISFDAGTTWYIIQSIALDISLTLTTSVAVTVSGQTYLYGAISGSVSVKSTTAGAATKVAAGTLTALQSQPAGVVSTTNPAAASGGADQETVAQAIARAPQAFTARDSAASASDYAYFASQILGIPGRAFAMANMNNTTPQNGYVSVALLSPSWTASSPVTAQERASVIRDLAGRVYCGATTIDVAMNIQQFIASPTLPAVLFFRQSGTDEASARVNIAKQLNTYLNPATYTPGRSVYLGDLEAASKAATGVDRVLDILGTKAVGMSWQAAGFSMTFTNASAAVTANAADVLNMKPYQTFIFDATNKAGYLVIAASGTSITLDRVFAGATVSVIPKFFHAQTTALANWYSVPFSNLSIDVSNPAASIQCVGTVV